MREDDAVVSGVVLLVGGSQKKIFDKFGLSGETNNISPKAIDSPLECIEILGKPMLSRTIERFRNADPMEITVLIDTSCVFPSGYPENDDNLKIRLTDNLWLAASETVSEYAKNGIQHAFIIDASTYVECDVIDLFEFHRYGGRTVTHTCDSSGPLAWWVVNCAKTQRKPLVSVLSATKKSNLPSYFVSSYTNRLQQPVDLRKLVVDVFRGACAMRPSGSEIRPGVFVEESAQIDKRARIVAPAFIGRGSKIQEDTLVTRSSNIESGCYIDCGTAIEDSSILPNTYVGICLDVSHSIVRQNMLLHVERNVEVEISDTSVVRKNAAVARQTTSETLVTLSHGPFGPVSLYAPPE